MKKLVIHPQHKHAVVMPATKMLEGANAFINALDYYKNPVDFYLLGGEKEEKYVKMAEKVKDLMVNVFFISLEEYSKRLIEFYPQLKKARGWLTMCARHRFVSEIAEFYDSTVTMDADTLLLNNIMKYFEIVAKTDLILMPRNYTGFPIERVQNVPDTEKRSWGSGGASVRNTPMFIDGKKFHSFLDEIIPEYMRNAISIDLGAMFRTLVKQKLLDKVLILPNCLWDLKSPNFAQIRREGAGDRVYFAIAKGDRINMVHSRWWNSQICARSDQSADGITNVRIFFELYKFFNTEWKIKIDFPYQWYGSQ